MRKTVRSLFPLIFLSIGLMSIAAESFHFPASGRFILPPSQGKDLFDQCSRPVPAKIAEYWQPSEKEVDELEVSLVKYLEQREKAGKSIPPKDVTYHRQYLGFVSSAGSTQPGERFIYGNFYPDSARHWAAGSESTRAFGVCDGGPAFWGIVYRVSTKTFEDPHFNGRA